MSEVSKSEYGFNELSIVSEKTENNSETRKDIESIEYTKSSKSISSKSKRSQSESSQSESSQSESSHSSKLLSDETKDKSSKNTESTKSSLCETKDESTDTTGCETKDESTNTSECETKDKSGDTSGCQTKDESKSSQTCDDTSGSSINLSQDVSGFDNSESSNSKKCKRGVCKDCSTASDNNSSSESGSEDHCNSKYYLPNQIGAFIDAGETVRYNVENGVKLDTPLLVGSRKKSGKDGKHGYRASHLIFEPKNSTLAVGHDTDNQWKKLPNFSLISGVGNKATLDGSFISGAHNKIESDFCSVTSHESESEHCLIPSSCAIVGGNNNTITNTSIHKRSSAIVASSNVSVRDCENTVVVGVKRNKKSECLEGFKNALIADNIYAFKSLHVGTPDCGSREPVLEAHGDLIVHGRLITSHGHHGESSVYVEGSSSERISHIVTENDATSVIYCNPIAGPIHIFLGSESQPHFQSNRSIIIKDVTPEFALGASHNIYISVPETNDHIPTRIEHYTNYPGGTCITASTGGTYVLNSGGGAVTFRYATLPIPGSYPTWVIENQLIGNPRLLTSTGMTFYPATQSKRKQVLKRK